MVAKFNHNFDAELKYLLFDEIGVEEYRVTTDIKSNGGKYFRINLWIYKDLYVGNNVARKIMNEGALEEVIKRLAIKHQSLPLVFSYYDAETQKELKI